MSFWELRTFIESMKILGYPFLISYASFKTPNFELMAKCLHWLVKRADPNFQYPLDIETESERVSLIKNICSYSQNKLHIKLNPKKLYTSDQTCVHELCKFSKLLGNASRFTALSIVDPGVDTSNPAELKETRALASDLTQDGARLSDFLELEKELHPSRIAALSVPMDPELVENILRQKSGDCEEEAEKLKVRMKELDTNRSALSEKITKKQEELERSKNRLQSLKAMKPAHLDEYDRVEEELRHIHQVYVQQFQNLMYLEKEMDNVYSKEREKYQEVEKILSKMQRQMLGQKFANDKANQEADGDLIDDDDEEDDDDDGQGGQGGRRGKPGQGQQSLAQTQAPGQNQGQGQGQQGGPPQKAPSQIRGGSGAHFARVGLGAGGAVPPPRKQPDPNDDEEEEEDDEDSGPPNNAPQQQQQAPQQQQQQRGGQAPPQGGDFNDEEEEEDEDGDE